MMHVKQVTHTPLRYETFNSLYKLTNDLEVTIVTDEDEIITITLKKGFLSDGMSVPDCLTWFLPKWRKDNDLYNIGALIHDAIYTEGRDGCLSREEADDILRGIVRKCGYSRLKAAIMDQALFFFAGCGNHWGNDDYDNLHLIHVKRDLVY